MTYQVSSEICGGFFYSGITLRCSWQVVAYISRAFTVSYWGFLSAFSRPILRAFCANRACAIHLGYPCVPRKFPHRDSDIRGLGRFIVPCRDLHFPGSCVLRRRLHLFPKKVVPDRASSQYIRTLPLTLPFPPTFTLDPSPPKCLQLLKSFLFPGRLIFLLVNAVL